MNSVPANKVPADITTQLFNDVYADFVLGSVRLSTSSLAKWCSDNEVSLERSFIFCQTSASDQSPIAVNKENAVGFSFLAVRPDVAREANIAGMGFVPAVRRKGHATRAFRQLLESEKRNGVKTIQVCNFTKNTAASNFFRKLGFRVTSDLPGWERGIPAPDEFPSAGASGLRECSVDTVAALVKEYGDRNSLPWQSWSFNNLPHSDRAFSLNDAFCVVSDPDSPTRDTIKMQCLIVKPAARGQRQATRLICAMLANFPGNKWRADPVHPEKYGDGIAAKLGFEHSPIGQQQMKLEIL